MKSLYQFLHLDFQLIILFLQFSYFLIFLLQLLQLFSHLTPVLHWLYIADVITFKWSQWWKVISNSFDIALTKTPLTCMLQPLIFSKQLKQLDQMLEYYLGIVFQQITETEHVSHTNLLDLFRIVHYWLSLF